MLIFHRQDAMIIDQTIHLVTQVTQQNIKWCRSNTLVSINALIGHGH